MDARKLIKNNLKNLKKMIFNLFEKKTEWIPLVAYNSSGTDYIVFVRKGVKSGMLFFKTKRNTPLGVCSYNFGKPIFDIEKQFQEVLSADNLTQKQKVLLTT
jgi:hypothetical protein